MRGEATRMFCALGLVLLYVAANFQGAYCFGGGGGGHGGGGGGGGHGGGFGGGHVGGGYSEGRSGGGGARPFFYGAGAGAGAGALAGSAASVSYSAAGEPQVRVASRASGTAALFAAAALVWWL